MDGKIKRAFIYDMSGAAALTAAMLYFFIYAVKIFPALAGSYNQQGESVAATLIGAFGTAFAAGIVATLLAVTAVAGMIAGIYALAVSAASPRILRRGKKKLYLGLQISSAILQVCACAVAICFTTLYAEYIPVLVLAAAALILLTAGFIYKLRNFRNISANPTV